MIGFHLGGFDFRPGTWSTVATLAMLVLTVALGGWQTRRAEEKLARQHRLDQRTQGAVLQLPAVTVAPAEFEYYRVSARGEFVPRHTLLVDNRVLHGSVGYNVLTPFRVAGGDLHVIVNRGWVAGGARRDELPKIRTPEGPLQLQGMAVVPPRRYYELGHETNAGPVVQNLSLERIAKRTGLKLQPIVMQQTTETSDDLVRVWDSADLGADTHRGYALQWYLLAVLTFVLYAVHSSVRVR
jgi:surfeit locus 1 family protein